MKTNVCLIASLRKPLRSMLLLTLFGLISFVFVTKMVGFILVQRETEGLGSYYRSIGILENLKDTQSGDISDGIDLIKTSPYFAYSNQPEMVSGVMSETYNRTAFSNSTLLLKSLSEEYWPNTHDADIWFLGELFEKEDVKLTEDGKTIGYALKFAIDTLFAAYPGDARQDGQIILLFLFEGNETVLPIIQEMAIGQRYFIHGWDDVGFIGPELSHYGARFQILPLDGQQLWYKPVAKNESLDFSIPEMISIKNKIDILIENQHALSVIATEDMSALPRMQEASHFFILTEGRWLNHQDHLAGSKVIVVPECLAKERGLELEDEIQLTFRPLQDAYYGRIRDGIDTDLWRSYPTYQDSFKIVGKYTHPQACVISAYIPTGSLQVGFTSTTQKQFGVEESYSFVLDSSRNQNQFTQTYKELLQAMDFSLIFLENNGPAYWAAVDPIRNSASADALIFGLLMVIALSTTVFLYMMQHKREYAILRALGIPVRQANKQTILPLLLFSGLGIGTGGLLAWNYALERANATLSTIPTPAGVYPSADLSPVIIIGLCLVIILLLVTFSWLGMFFLSKRSVFELLQGKTNRSEGGKKQARTNTFSQPDPSLSSGLIDPVSSIGEPTRVGATKQSKVVVRRKYSPSSLIWYVIHHGLRSWPKSILTLAVALGFILSLGWIQHTLEHSRIEIDRLYETTVLEADIVPVDPTAGSYVGSQPSGNGYVYLKTINNVLNSGHVTSSRLEADTILIRIQKANAQEKIDGSFPVYAYDSPETFSSSLADPESLTFTSGWDVNLFARQWTLEDLQQEDVPLIFPSDLLEQMKLKVGDQIMVTNRLMDTYSGVIAGQYAGGRVVNTNNVKIQWIGAEPIFIPLSALITMEGNHTAFTVAHFSLDPVSNRELSQISSDIEIIITASGAGKKELSFIIWDEQLRVVITPLEKNISLLQVLFPVVMAVIILIGAGLCFLLLLQTAKEAAILRVLGTTRPVVRMVLISGTLCLSIIGVGIGLGITYIFWMSSGLVPVGPLLIGAGLYLAGVLIGLAAGAILVTNKQPIDLLQVKE